MLTKNYYSYDSCVFFLDHLKIKSAHWFLIAWLALLWIYIPLLIHRISKIKERYISRSFRSWRYKKKDLGHDIIISTCAPLNHERFVSCFLGLTQQKSCNTVAHLDSTVFTCMHASYLFYLSSLSIHQKNKAFTNNADMNAYNLYIYPICFIHCFWLIGYFFFFNYY